MEKELLQKLEDRLEKWKRDNPQHNFPSPKTIEMINNLENNIIKYQQKMEDLIAQNTKEHQELKMLIKEEIFSLIKVLDGKANKWVEKVMIGVGAAIGTGFLGIIGWIIVEAIKRFQ